MDEKIGDVLTMGDSPSDADPLHADVTESLTDSRRENTRGDKIADSRSPQRRPWHHHECQQPKNGSAGSERNQRTGEGIGVNQAAPHEDMGDREQQRGLKRVVFSHERR